MSQSALKMDRPKFSERMGDLVRRILSCCDRDHDRPALQISAPMNFRREDVSITGLTEMQQTSIRDKAKADAKEVWQTLQPLRSSPSGTFADRPGPPPYEEFSLDREKPGYPALLGSVSKRQNRESRLDRVKAHSRKISASLTRPRGFSGVDRHDSNHELKGLMCDEVLYVNAAKTSTESFSVASSEEESYARSKV